MVTHRDDTQLKAEDGSRSGGREGREGKWEQPGVVTRLGRDERAAP